MQIKNLLFIFMIVLVASSCKKNIDQYPTSNLYDNVYYKNVTEFDAALVGCYNGMQKPMFEEWSLTELRSDNAIMGNPTSGSIPNRELSDLDLLAPNTYHERVYNYWLSSYYNIYNTNKILSNLAVKYDSLNGNLKYDSVNLPVTSADRKRIAAQASFIRAYHYFNLVRLYGGVFLIDRPVTPAESKMINRSSVADIYKLIIADLNNAKDYGDQASFTAINPSNLGRANSWSAKALLAKVYLTLNQKAQATALLQDIISNSGYRLQTSYTDVFSITNEMNSEILFAVRYKSGKVGLGSPFCNIFAPSSSGNYIVNGDGDGYGYPSYELDTIQKNYIVSPPNTSYYFDSLRTNSYDPNDPRRTFNIKHYDTDTLRPVFYWTPSPPPSTNPNGKRNNPKAYNNKFILFNKTYLTSPLVYQDDGENDWPVIRYADVLLMLAEAQGYTPSSVQLINQIRSRVALSPVTPINIAKFNQDLSNERRFEFAFENQRWFDLIRFNVTLSPNFAENTLKTHFRYMHNQYGGNHYNGYTPAIILANLLAQVNEAHLLLPIPQREIDNNTNIVIQQNPGY